MMAVIFITTLRQRKTTISNQNQSQSAATTPTTEMRPRHHLPMRTLRGMKSPVLPKC
ncbi:hypothetical protein M9458_004013, partial [Cirrhinus mrigala]